MHVAHLSCRKDSNVVAAGPVGQWCDKKSLETWPRRGSRRGRFRKGKAGDLPSKHRENDMEHGRFHKKKNKDAVGFMVDFYSLKVGL